MDTVEEHPILKGILSSGQRPSHHSNSNSREYHRPDRAFAGRFGGGVQCSEDDRSLERSIITAVRFGRVPKREKAKILAAMQSVASRSQERALEADLQNEDHLITTIIQVSIS